MSESIMILMCWTGSNLEGLVKAFKYLELASSNMLAITNLAVCINLALIVSRELDWVVISTFFLELAVGAAMFLIVGWLLLFRLKEIKECWKLYTSIRFYFGLTLIGTAVNLALGICGTIYVIQDYEGQLLIVLSWTFRYIHIALDTIVQYGVLGARQMDERAPSPTSSTILSRTKSSSSSRSRRRRDPNKLRAGDRQRSSSNESNNDHHQRHHHYPRGTITSEGSNRRAVHPTITSDNRFSSSPQDAVNTV
ncbi:unnamed protein product [Scytosiphon promiscuus]